MFTVGTKRFRCTESIFPDRRPMSSQTTASSLLASNASVTRKCCSSPAFSLRIPRHLFPEQHECDVDIRKKLYAVCRAVSGTATFLKVFERMMKVLTASAPSAMKIMVVIPPDQNISTVGAKTLPLRGSDAPAKSSARLQSRMHLS